MGEALTEEALEDVEEPSEAQKSLEYTIEQGGSVESRFSPREEYKSELGDDRYQLTRRYRKREQKVQNKNSPSTREKSLDYLIESSKDVSFAIDEEGKVVPTYKGRRVYGEGYSMPIRFIGKEINESKSREIHDSFDGVHAIIFHQDPETGQIYFAFEKKPLDYPISEYAGTLSLYGGSIKIGEPPNEGLVRELKEEDPAYRIVIKALNETRWKVAEITKHSDGAPSTTYIWAANIKDPIEWNKYLLGKSTEGDKTSKSLEEIRSMNDTNFAFGFGPIVKGVANVLRENYSKVYSYHPLNNSFSNNTFSSISFHNLN